jgi:hypothetical protein
MSISLTVLSGEVGGENYKVKMFKQCCSMDIFLTVLSGEAGGGGNYNVKMISAVL